MITYKAYTLTNIIKQNIVDLEIEIDLKMACIKNKDDKNKIYYLLYNLFQYKKLLENLEGRG